MSRGEVAAESIVALGGQGACVDAYPTREVALGPLTVTLRSTAGARLVLIGGPPFPETILMWWNFVARTPEEIRAARDDWEAHRRFGDVPAYRGPRLAAPDLLRLARPNPLS